MSESHPKSSSEVAGDPKDRRNAVTVILGMIIGTVVAIIPLVPGLAVLADPVLRRKKRGGKAIRITTLSALPADGLPHRFQVVDIREDKWNVYPPEPIDGVFLVRSSSDELPKAYSATCPHLGCAVDFKTNAGQYQCPCHTSGFAVNGDVLFGPSPRGLDELTVEIRNEEEVWIEYKRFRVGKSKQVEV